MGVLKRRVISGPKSNFIQMTINYLYNITTSVYFVLLTGHYIQNQTELNTIKLELFLNFICLSFSISCSFVDPGIITSKSNLEEFEADTEIPQSSILNGSDFYMYFN